MNPQVRRLREELAQLKAALPKEGPPPQFLDSNFPHQSDYILDPAKLKVAITTRRAGKSYGDGLYLLKEAFEAPVGDVLYLALTRDSVKRSVWERVLKPINRALKLGGIPNETTLSMRLPSGGIVYSLGGDSSQDEQQKLLSGKYKLIIVDEAGAFRIDLNKLVFGTLKPMVADYNGTICLSGFPGNVKAGLFYELTKDQDPQLPGRFSITAGEPAMKWSGHTWNTAHNPHMKEKWATEIAELTKNNPGIEATPLFIQHYLGRWMVDESKLVYRYDSRRNSFKNELPKPEKGAWRYVLGVDLGYEDASAFVLCAYHDHLKELYVLEAFKQSKLDLSQVAIRIEHYRKRYEVERIIIDNSAKQAVAEMENRYGLPLTAADKKGKADFVELMNSDFLLGKIKLSASAMPLADEYLNLVWDEQALAQRRKKVEHPACDNHCADAALYAWRYCYGYLSEPIVDKPKEGTEEFTHAQVQELFQREREMLRLKKEQELEMMGQFDFGIHPEMWDERLR